MLTVAQEIEVHREVVRATFKGALRFTRHENVSFFEQVGISRRYFEYILTGEHTPSPEVARQLVNAIPLPPEQRQDLSEHLSLLSVKRAEYFHQSQSLKEYEALQQVIREFRDTHDVVAYSRDSQRVFTLYRAMEKVASSVVRSFKPQRDPRLFIDVCLRAIDMESVLNKHSTALWYALMAQAVLANNDVPGDTRDCIIDSIRCQAIAYHNLNLNDDATRLCRDLEDRLRTPAFREKIGMWQPHLSRDLLNSLSETNRFSIGEAEAVAKSGKDAMEQGYYDSKRDVIYEILIDLSLARAYLNKGGSLNLKKAHVLIQRELDRVVDVAHFGMLHTVMLYRLTATYYNALGDARSQQEYALRAFQIASQAGLAHQRKLIMQQFAGLHLDEPLTSLPGLAA